MKIPPLSYSAVKQWDNCPKQYHEVRILKRFKSQETEATSYGTLVHKALEEHVRDKKPIPENLSHYQKFVDPIVKIKGTTQCEVKLGIRSDFSPCGFFDKDVWFRGVPDVLIINEETGIARTIDYKTGKSSRYADTAQLELMAGMVMAHYPQVKVVKGALIFLVANDIVKVRYTRAQFSEIMSKWAGKASMIEAAMEHGVWNPRTGPLCRFCPVSDCTHNPN